MKFKMIFLALISGISLSSLSLSAMNAAEKEYASQGYVPVTSNQHGLVLFVRAAQNNDQKQINALYKLYNNRAFIVALNASTGDAIDIPGELNSLVTYTFQPGVLDKARAMLKIAEQNK